jgi:hypothetical protein
MSDASALISEFATQTAVSLGIECLVAPWPNYNEGQKTLIKDYTTIDADISVNVDVASFGFFVQLSLDVAGYSFDIEGTHEEAFGSLYDDTEMIVETFINDAFNFEDEGLLFEPVLEFIENFGDSVWEARRRIAVFS